MYNLWVLTYVYTCQTIAVIKKMNTSVNSSPPALCAPPSHCRQPLGPFMLLHICAYFLELIIGGITPYVFFSSFFLSLSMVIQRLTHAVCIDNRFHCWGIIHCMDIPIYHSFADGHLIPPPPSFWLLRKLLCTITYIYILGYAWKFL